MRNRIHLLAVGLLSVCMLNCSESSRDKARVDAVVASQIHQLVIAIHAYSYEHQGRLPDSLDQLAVQVGGTNALADLMRHPGTGEAIGVIYVKPGEKWRNVADPSYTPMLYEAREGKPYTSGRIGYVDGSVRLPEATQ